MSNKISETVFKKGDLVRQRWTTFASKRRAENMGRLVDELGLIIEAHKHGCKVIFPSTGTTVHTFLMDDLEGLSSSDTGGCIDGL